MEEAGELKYYLSSVENYKGEYYKMKNSILK
jgi:hypothetical protein